MKTTIQNIPNNMFATMQNKFKCLFTIAVVIVVAASCSKNDDATIDDNTNGINDKVFVVGTEILSNSNGSQPILWTDGVKTTLPFLAGSKTQALKVKVVNNDVYIVGIENITDFQNNLIMRNIVLWKNGVQSKITNGSRFVDVHELVIDNANVYVLGEENVSNTGDNKFKIWKNGTATEIVNAQNAQGQDNSVSNLTVANNDVYVIATEKPIGSSTTQAKLYKNGVGTKVNTTASKASAQSLSVVGTEVSVFFTELNAPNFKFEAKLWKNNVVSVVSDPTISSESRSLIIRNAITHIVYREGQSSDNSKIIYLKNGARTVVVSNTLPNIFLDMKVDGDNVSILFSENDILKYWLNGVVKTVVGADRFLGQTFFLKGSNVYIINEVDAKLWKNGIETPLPLNGSTSSFDTNDIFVN